MFTSQEQPSKSIKNIKELLVHFDLTCQQLAQYFGIAHRVIQDWEDAKRDCPKYLLDLLVYKITQVGRDAIIQESTETDVSDETRQFVESITTVKELRFYSRFTQKQFSEYFGISHRAIQNWEGGQRNCPQHLFDLMVYKMVHEGVVKLPSDVSTITNIKELRARSGFTKNQFGEYFGIPLGTPPKWENGERPCPEYLLDLMIYKMEHEGILGPNNKTKPQKDIPKFDNLVSSIKELCELTGFTKNQLYDYFAIPSEKAEQWKINERTNRKYVLDLMVYKMVREGIIDYNKISNT